MDRTDRCALLILNGIGTEALKLHDKVRDASRDFNKTKRKFNQKEITLLKDTLGDMCVLSGVKFDSLMEVLNGEDLDESSY